MRMLKKQVQKEDGRYLVYYHCPESATAEQVAAFASVEAEAETVGNAAAKNTSASSTRREETERV